MINTKAVIAPKQIKNVTYLGVLTNIVLAVFKLFVGTLVGSMSLFADGIHSISDMVTDVVVLLGIRLSVKGADHEHPYGHGRAETFSATVVAALLIFVGGAMAYRASIEIAGSQAASEDIETLSPLVFWIAMSSVIAKEALYRITRTVAKRTGSSALYANAWHHRSDALSSVAVVIGFVAMKFGYQQGDHIATIAVGLMIILVGVKIIGGCFHEFAQRAVDSDTMAQIELTIASEHRIRDWHKLRTRSAGREIFMDLHILVDPQLNITDAHEIADSLEQSMHAKIPRPVNIMVHVEPDVPGKRK